VKNKHWILPAIAVLVAVTLACGPSGGTPAAEEQPTAEPKATLPPADTPVPESQEATLEITNNSGVDVWYVYLSPSKADEWGEDWLGDDVIGDGETYTIVGIPEGVYDVKAEDPDNEVIEVAWEVDFDGDMTWDITGMASLEVVNESGDTIAYLYISPSDSDTWGDDWLGEDVIDAGDSHVVGDIPRGTYDIQATDLDEETKWCTTSISPASIPGRWWARRSCRTTPCCASRTTLATTATTGGTPMRARTSSTCPPPTASTAF